ncbi:MAG: DUF881 domain-containing protein [Peptostreptococcaceae bacterium]
MKNKYMLIILTSAVLGIFIGLELKEPQIKEDSYISKDRATKNQINITDKSIKNLEKESEKLHKELDNLKEEHTDTESVEELQSLKEILSYTDLEGEGISIKIDALSEEIGNIANFVDYNKILINIVNEVKSNGGRYISINGQRINHYSEIVLAGNHININSMPVAPPYEIKIIGNFEQLSNYMDKGSKYLNSIQVNYPIKVEMKLEKSITMKKMNLPNKLKYIEGE